jgi:hypothetical protein
MIGIEPTMSIMANITIKTEKISLKLKFILNIFIKFKMQMS